jgi:hypothetical protein
VFEDADFDFALPISVDALRLVMICLAGTLLLGGGLAWLADAVPGLRSVRSAIEWSTAADAISRLLSIGCTYPEAFRTATKVVGGRAGRNWLEDAARRVERGGGELSGTATGDAVIAELMVDADRDRPIEQWRITSDHFFDVADRRSNLLLGTVPIVATILSGIFVWASISASLGMMWRAVAEMIGGLA